eukprot:14181188-Ditylum_brightwellii.AAC.1
MDISSFASTTVCMCFAAVHAFLLPLLLLKIMGPLKDTAAATGDFIIDGDTMHSSGVYPSFMSARSST